MTIQLADSVRNARLDAIETVVGSAPYLDIRTGPPPADCASADVGTELAHIALPSDWMNPAASGTKSMAGTWQGTAIGNGDAGHFRIKNNADTTCLMQGTISATGGVGDLTLDNVSIAVDQPVTVTSFTLTDGNS